MKLVSCAFAVLLVLWAAVLIVFLLPGTPFGPQQARVDPSNPLESSQQTQQRADILGSGQRLRQGASTHDGSEKAAPLTHKRTPPRSVGAIGRSVLEVPAIVPHQPELVHKPPAPVDVIMTNFTRYFHTLHRRLQQEAGQSASPEGIWNAYFEVSRDTILKWEEAHSGEFPRPRDDGSIFVSMASYRDMYCPQTMDTMYAGAVHPEQLFVGLVQQNCYENCRSGVLEGGRVESAPADVDCYAEFCATTRGKPICENGQVLLLRVNESESLGPMAARYFASKLYRGETYYLQIDSHSVFDTKWDVELINMMNSAPSDKPIITGYPPEPEGRWQGSIGLRICNSLFATSDIEWQIVRLEASFQYDKIYSNVPRYAPFVAAGFFFAPGGFLKDVPFDPLLPWVFMGEEIAISIRLWTSGYDIFSPTKNVLAHYYVRRHKPKYWESVNRFFKKPIHNQVDTIVVRRIKHLLRYPESVRDMIHPPSVLYAIERYSYGTVRPPQAYWKMVGIDVKTKTITQPEWCHKGTRPKIYEELGLPTAKSPTL